MPDGMEGCITCIYDEAGYLMEFAVGSWDIKREDHGLVLERIGNMLTDGQMIAYVKSEGIYCRKARIDLSFERFWNMYGYARNKIPAMKLWNMMKDKEKYLVLVNLKAYNRYCLRNPTYTKLCPDTYLRSHTKDNWDKVEDFKK